MEIKTKLTQKSSGLSIAIGILPCYIKAKLSLILLKAYLGKNAKKILKTLANYRFLYRCNLELREYCKRQNTTLEYPDFQLE